MRTILHSIIILLITLGVSYGQEEEYEVFKEIKDIRTLGGHYFTPGTTIKSPFISTYIKTTLGVGGIEGLKYPLIQIGDREYLFQQGDVFAAMLSLEYQHAVKDWLAVFLRYELIGRLGSDFGTLVKQGVNYATVFDIGWLVRVYRSERLTIATNIHVSNGHYSIISLKNFTNLIVDNLSDNPIISNNNSLYGLWGVRAAYGINSLLGFNIIADAGYGEAIQRQSENKWFTVMGFKTDLNFTDYIKIPLSLSLGYLYNSYPDKNEDIIFSNHIFISELNYIGRTNFALGLEFTLNDELISGKEKSVWLNSTRFSMRYFF